MSQDIRNLGTYANIAALWEAHPEGGREGDYATVSGTRYRWNKYDRIWENGATVTQTTGTRNHVVEGDQEVTGDVTVLGTLRAKHVKQPHMGMYASEEALLAAIPTPERGWYALVGNELPAELYVCNTAGTWTDTGNEYDGESVDLTEYVKATVFQDYTNRGYKILGDATPSATPSSPSAGDAYLASTPGTYTNFGGTVLADGQMAMFKYNGSSWSASILQVGKSYDSEIEQLETEATDAYQFVLESSPVDLNDLTKRNFQINSSNKYTSVTSYKHVLVPVVPGDIIVVTASSEHSAQMAWLTNNDQPTAGGTPNFVSGTERFDLASGEIGHYTVPAGANYMYFYAGQSPYEFLPQSVSVKKSKIPSFSVLDRLDSTSKNDALSANKGKELKDDINGLSSAIDKQMDISSLSSVSYAYITSGGTYAATTGKYGKFLPVSAGQKYKIYGHADNASYYSFLTSKSVSAGGTPAYVTGTTRMSIDAGAFVIVTVPEGCNYLQLNTVYDNTDRTPNSIVLLGGNIAGLNEKDVQLQTEISDTQERLAGGVIGEMPLNATLTSGHGISTETGEQTDSSSLSVTDYISLENVSSIELTVNVGSIVNTKRGIAFYDAGKVFMRGISYPYDTSLESKTFTVKKYTVPAGAAFFRTCFFTDFESDFKCTLFRSDASENLATLLAGYISVSGKDLLTIGSPEIYHHPAIESGANATTTEQIYALYDELATLYPTWFTRESDIGTSSDGVHEIRHYRLRYNYNAVWTKGDYNNNRWEDFYSWRKLLLNAGTHGDEQSAVWGLYFFIKALLEGDGEKWAEYIRSNIQIDIVPVLNPYGLNHNTRSNANGVDINRQFSNTSCVESEALKALARDVLPFAFIDCHTVGTTHGNYLGYLGCTQGNPFFPTLARLVNNLAAVCRADWSALASSVSIGNKPYIYCSIGEVTSNPTVAVGWIGANITQISTVCEALNVGSTSNKGKPMAKIIVDILANLIPTLMEVGSY